MPASEKRAIIIKTKQTMKTNESRNKEFNASRAVSKLDFITKQGGKLKCERDQVAGPDLCPAKSPNQERNRQLQREANIDSAMKEYSREENRIDRKGKY